MVYEEEGGYRFPQRVLRSPVTPLEQQFEKMYGMDGWLHVSFT